jgi:hypothetical protein
MKWFRYIALYGITVLVTLLMIELYLREAEIILPKVEVDPLLGEVYLPNTRVAEFFEGYYMGKINEYRYLGEANHVRNDAREVHIGLIGDSFVAGLELFERHHFKTVMEAQLNAHSNKKYRISNFGKDGLNLSGIYSYFQKYVSQYDMDYYLFFVNWENFWDDERQFTPNYELVDDKLVLKTDFTESGAYQTYDKLRPMTRSALVFLAYKCRAIVRNGLAGQVLFGKFYPQAPQVQRSPEQKRKDEQYRYELNDVKRAILEELAKNDKIILVIDDKIPDEIDQVIRQLNFRTIYLDGVIQDRISQGFDPYYWEVSGKKGHWNAPTHQVIGAYLAERVKEILETKKITTSK